MTSANGKYGYDDEFFGVEINEYVDNIHKKMSEHYKWKYSPLKKYSFGYDNLINSIGKALDYSFNKNGQVTIDELADMVHKGWIDNYTFWRDEKPYMTSMSLYIKPYNALGDERRDKCASTEYKDLPEEEKEKDLLIAKILFEIINKQDWTKDNKLEEIVNELLYTN
jgi:hypothetical protein